LVLAVYDIAEELDQKQGYHCLWCLVISSAIMNMITKKESQHQTLNVYSTEKQRDNALKYWRRQHILTETVFFTFEIPIDFYLENSEKQI